MCLKDKIDIAFHVVEFPYISTIVVVILRL